MKKNHVYMLLIGLFLLAIVFAFGYQQYANAQVNNQTSNSLSNGISDAISQNNGQQGLSNTFCPYWKNNRNANCWRNSNWNSSPNNTNDQYGYQNQFRKGKGNRQGYGKRSNFCWKYNNVQNNP